MDNGSRPLPIVQGDRPTMSRLLYPSPIPSFQKPSLPFPLFCLWFHIQRSPSSYQIVPLTENPKNKNPVNSTTFPGEPHRYDVEHANKGPAARQRSTAPQSRCRNTAHWSR